VRRFASGIQASSHQLLSLVCVVERTRYGDSGSSSDAILFASDAPGALPSSLARLNDFISALPLRFPTQPNPSPAVFIPLSQKKAGQPLRPYLSSPRTLRKSTTPYPPALKRRATDSRRPSRSTQGKDWIGRKHVSRREWKRTVRSLPCAGHVG
jgi:hypothetical protein